MPRFCAHAIRSSRAARSRRPAVTSRSPCVETRCSSSPAKAEPRSPTTSSSSSSMVTCEFAVGLGGMMGVVLITSRCYLRSFFFSLGGRVSLLNIYSGVPLHHHRDVTVTRWWRSTGTCTCSVVRRTTHCPTSSTVTMSTPRPGRSFSPVLIVR